MSKPHDFDDLFPGAPKKAASAAWLEAEKRRLVAEVNAWIRIRDEAKKEALAAGADPEATPTAKDSREEA